MTMFQSGHGLAIKFLLEHYPRGSIGEENVVDDVGGVILLILGSIPNSADPMVVWFFPFSDDVRRRRENITM